jgi:glycosidase
LQQNYPKEALYDLMNIVDSHDTVRAIYKFGGGAENAAIARLSDFDYELGKKRLKLAAIFLMGYPGMPTIYYGDEAGVFGSADPDCRRTYPWGSEDKELIDFYTKVIFVRNNNKKLFAHGDVNTLFAEGDCYAYERTAKNEAAIVALNRGAAKTLELSVKYAEGTEFGDALDEGYKAVVKDGRLTLKLGENQGRMMLKKQ